MTTQRLFDRRSAPVAIISGLAAAPFPTHAVQAATGVLAATGTLRLAVFAGSPISFVEDPRTGEQRGRGHTRRMPSEPTVASPASLARGPTWLVSLRAASSLAIVCLAVLVAVGTLGVGTLGREHLARGVVAALLAAIIGGTWVATALRAPAAVTAPASSVVVIYAALAADLAARGHSLAQIWFGLSLCVVLMGVLLLLAGWMRIADAVKFLPSPVTAGFVTGIGLLVIWAQVPPLLGLEGRLSSHAGSAIGELVKPGALATGAAAAFAAWWWPRRNWPGPGALVALVVGTSVHHLLNASGPGTSLGPVLGALDIQAAAVASAVSVWQGAEASQLLATFQRVLPYAAFLVLQAVMNAAVNASTAASAMGVSPVPLDRLLRAEGLANMACGFVGAMPVTSSAPLTAAAAEQRADHRTIVLAFVLLLVALLLAGRLLSQVPIAALAGILVISGYALVDKWALGLAGRVWRGGWRAESQAVMNLALVAAVAAAFFGGGVPVALLVGAVLAMVLLAVNLSRTTTFTMVEGPALVSTRSWPPAQAAQLLTLRHEVALVRPRGGLFFGTADQLARRLAELPADVRYCIVDLARTTTIDATACQMLTAGARRLQARGIEVLLAGVSSASARARELAAQGLDVPRGAGGWFEDADHAIEWIEGRQLGGALDDARESSNALERSPLAAGLVPASLALLRERLHAVSMAPGTLFRKDEPADSMYVVLSGGVEIRVTNPETGRTTRLAAFGPGSIFGEISLLSTGRRSADAICVEASELLELRREDFGALAAVDAALHAQLLRNLGVHLANRLVVATGTLKAQQ